MKRTTTLFTLILFVCFSSFSQNVNLRSQLDLDNFDPSITVINGDLIILENISTSDPIIDLSNLNNLDSVYGEIIIQGCGKLENLSNFKNLRHVGSSLTIMANDSLNSTAGFEALQCMKGHLFIRANHNLKSLDGFSNLEEVDALTIEFNRHLETIVAFSNLKKIGSFTLFENFDLLHINGLLSLDSTNYLTITNNYSLENLDGFSSIKHLEYLFIQNNWKLENLNGLQGISLLDNLTIFNNPKLIQIDALSNVTNINLISIGRNRVLQNIDGLNGLYGQQGSISIQFNDSLTNVDGLSNVEEIQTDLYISSNHSLENLNGLFNVKRVFSNLAITNNSKLTSCCAIIPLLNDSSGIGGFKSILNNGQSCNSETEIITNGCQGPNIAFGTFYLDNNEDDCATSTVEVSDYSIIQQSTSGSKTYSSRISADFNIFLDDGINIIVPTPLNSHLPIHPDTLILVWSEDSLLLENNFCVSILEEFDDLEITLIPTTQARPGFISDYLIQYRNNGVLPISGEVTFLYSELTATYENSSMSPTILNDGEITWTYDDLLPFEQRSIAISLLLNTPMDNPPLMGGEVLSFNVEIDPSEDDDKPDDNSFELNQQIVNSFDPNDKTCLEGEIIAPEQIGDYLNYLIRFENTGSANAIHIDIIDTIDINSFDISTLKINASSHECIAEIQGNTVTFIFDYINLPFDDENNDGFVSFKIKTKDQVAIGDYLTNKAEIFFDFNFPIETNTASTQVVLVSTKDLKQIETLTIFPNPSDQTIYFDLPTEDEFHCKIMDSNGALVLNSVFSGLESAKLDISRLESGIFLVRLLSKSGQYDSSSRFVKMK